MKLGRALFLTFAVASTIYAQGFDVACANAVLSPIKVSGASTLDVTNTQKLALTGISVGQRVSVSDAIYITGAGDVTVNGLFLPKAADQHNGRDYYGSDEGDGDFWFRWNDSPDAIYWGLGDNNDGEIYYSQIGVDVAQPWDITEWYPAQGLNPKPTIVHPVVQQFTGGDPSDEANWSVVP